MKYQIFAIIIWAGLIAFMIGAATGCIPDMPNVPTGATCSQDGYVLRPVITGNDFETLEFVLDDEGAAMGCVFTYG